MMQEQKEPYVHEIDLASYIKVIWENKWIIVLITVLVAGAAYGFSKMQPAQYETRTSLLITPRISEQIVRRDEGGLSSVSLPARAYERSALSAGILQQVIKDLGLKNEEGELIKTASLKGRIEIDVDMEPQQTSNGSSVKVPLITMSVRGQDPQEIRNIANKWAELFVKRNTKLLSSETARSYEFISGRFREVNKNLITKEEQKLNFKKEHPLSVLESEVKVLREKYEDFLSQLKSKRAELKEKKARLDSLGTILAEEPKYLELQKSIPRESIWNFLQETKSDTEVNDDNEVINELEKLADLKITDQQTNSIYFSLKEKKQNIQADISSLRESVAYLQKKTEEFSSEIERIQFEIDRAKLKLEQYNREIDRLTNTYKTLSENLEEARIAKEEKESSIRIMDEAVAPEKAKSANTKQNVIVGGVLGLFIGILFSFFKNYMEGYDKEEDEESKEQSEK